MSAAACIQIPGCHISWITTFQMSALFFKSNSEENTPSEHLLHESTNARAPTFEKPTIVSSAASGSLFLQWSDNLD